MKWLLITNDDEHEQSFSKKINDALFSADKKNKLVSTNFETANVKKYAKQCEEFAACVIAQKNGDGLSQGETVLLSTAAGYFFAKNIPIFTNVVFLKENALLNKSVTAFSDEKEFFKELDKNYKNIVENAVKRLAKNKLLERGIPFTSDCFATYIAKNKLKIVNEFLEAGMSINEKDDAGVPMLNIACRNDNFDFVTEFLKLGADLNAVSDDRGYTAVMDAVWRGNEKIAKYLIEQGADLNTINKEGQTNLILAVGTGHENIVKLLAENGSNPDTKDSMGMSAYTYAVLFKKTRIAEILKPFHKE